MANTYINITTQGDGSVSFVSSSGGKLIEYIGSNCSGIYESQFDYKFALNKKCVSINTLHTTGSLLSSSSIFIQSSDNGVRIDTVGIDNIVSSSYTQYKDRSFTLMNIGVNTSYDVDVLFYPKLNTYSLMSRKRDHPETDPNEPFVFLNDNNNITEVVMSGKELPLDNDYLNGYMYRYFYKISNNTSNTIRELLKKQYDIILNNSTYSSIQIKWTIVGTQSEVETINMGTLESSDISMLGIKNLLKKNLSLYRKDK